MLVDRIEARTVVVPLERPARISRRPLERRHYTLVRVHASDGLVGIGFCLGGTPVTNFVREVVAPGVVGQPIVDTERLWDDLYYRSILNGRRGGGLRALSIVDIALWDLKAKMVSLPLAHLLGVYQDPVPAYASGGYYFEGSDPVREVEEEAGGWAEAGYRAMKLKVGGVPVEDDVARLAAFRRVVGDKPRLMLDANNAWRDWRTALRAVRRFEEFDLEWIEEPLSPDDVDGHRRLSEALDVPVATGEIEATRWGFAALLRDHAADVLQPDAAVAGGISEWRKIADAAAMFNVPIAPHWFADLHVHCVASVPNGIWIEHFVDTRILNVMKLFERSLEVSDGYAAVPAEPGLGIAFRDTEVDRHAVDGWA
ncbi:MAG: mandelate racemase/muconate lactonizing enzyme family protein [Nocardioidaceae bacterium]